ncbi:DUF2860 domain-containing protein [Aeromonas encheleia]|uniref:DUF2860 domain-containing protein n=1 Tax=Aeromonas encheleia TaxID=73010 RepID=A0AAE9MFY3_9GAMM|nr:MULTISPECIES: DUF2860 family protein [Aeromonas]MBV7597324.1 DUF2860 domain-containing protein [Aeromonas sp. sia0103]UNP89131.1 DUF2860 domain-containing protein [Aeromonas encheleia]USV56936.1 DUF2860 domain-containing protein [Aeromonas encheleia]
MRNLTLLSLSLLVANAAHADLGAIPTQSGWSGFLLGGVSAISHESNFYAGGDSNGHIDGLGSPASESELAPLINADIRYTFADTRTQVFLGNLIQDALRFDFTQQLGIRQEMGDKGIVAGSVVFNAMPVELWSDPFAVGVERSTTDAKSKGVRFAWDKIWGSNFNGSLTSREMELDEERSGQQYDQRNGTHYAPMLDRNGKIHDMELSYQWHFGGGQLLEPAILYKQADLDGSAESFKNLGMQLTYAKRGPQWSVVGNAYAGKREYDEANPLFGQRADAREFVLAGTFFWHNLMGVRDLSATVTAAYNQADSDIAFYDTQTSILSAGLLYNF